MTFVAAQRTLGRALGPWWLWLVTGLAWMLVALLLLRFDYTSVSAISLLFGFVAISAGVVEIGVLMLARGWWKLIHALVAFLFIAWHVWSTRMQYYFYGAEITYDFMRAIMTDPLRFGFFLVGVLASVFHFTNGIWTFCITWGITVGQRAQRTVRAVAMVFFLVMYGTAVAIMLAFRA